MISLTHIFEKGSRVQTKWAIMEFIEKDNMVQTK